MVLMNYVKLVSVFGLSDHQDWEPFPFSPNHSYPWWHSDESLMPQSIIKFTNHPNWLSFKLWTIFLTLVVSRRNQSLWIYYSNFASNACFILWMLLRLMFLGLIYDFIMRWHWCRNASLAYFTTISFLFTILY